jgi:hypothetical protein
VSLPSKERDAVALLSGKQTTTFEWHDPWTLPPVGVPLIVNIENEHEPAKFTGDRLKFCNGSHIPLRRDGMWDQSYEIKAIAWEVKS